MDSFLEIFYQDRGKDIRSYLPHNDYAVEILQTWSEGGHFLIKDCIFPIQTAGVYIINAMDTHCSKPIEIEKYVRSKFIISYDYFLQIASLLNLEEQTSYILEKGGQCFPPVPPYEKHFYRIDQLFQQAHEISVHESPFRSAKLCHILTEMLLILFEKIPTYDISKQNRTSPTERQLNIITAYINKAQNCELSLDRISSDLHMSKSSVCHLFKKHTGIPVIQYANNLRMSRAKKLLATTNLKIHEISSMLGFSSCTVFCKTFKKHTGISPQKYRCDDYHVSESAFPKMD